MKILYHQFKGKTQFLKELEKSQIPADARQILVQVFSGNLDRSYLQNLMGFLRKTLPHCLIMGVTSAGEIFQDHVLTHSVVLSILCFEQSTLQMEKSSDSIGNSFDQGVYLGKKLQRKDLQTIILLGEGLFLNGEDLLKGMESATGDIVIAGGLAGDNWSFRQTYLLCQDEVLNRGAVAVGIYSETLRVRAYWTFDCDMVGKKFIVTQADENIVKKIDDITPETLYQKYIGEHLDFNFTQMGVQFPLVVNRNGEKLARVPLRLFPEGALEFSGNLREGETVQFGIANIDKMLNRSVSIYNDIDVQWDAVCIFSCAIRKRILDSKAFLDIHHYKNIAPVSGFFSYGEFIKEKGSPSRFCTHTMVLLLLSESENIPIVKPVPKTIRGDTSVLENVSRFTNVLLQENEQKREELSKSLEEQLWIVKQKNRIMEDMLYRDSLTGLKNRTLLFQEMGEKKPAGIMLIDIQSFRAINDLYGEAVGNLILQAFADFLRRISDNHEHIYRLASNTFAFLNVFSSEADRYMVFAREIIKAVEAENFYFETGGTTLECAISVTIGLSNNKGGCTPLEEADMALNHAKKHHKNIIMYEDSLNIKEGYERDISIIKLVKKALDDDRVVPFFQPVFSGEEIAYYESLIRVVKENGKVLTPFHFLDIIKGTTYYVYLTRRMIQKVFEIFHQIDSIVSINLSFLDFSNTGTVNYLVNMIEKYNMGKKLILEIVESEIFQDYQSTNEQIERLRALGARIAIDDFGSGYSNFLHLTMINPDYIKIDGSLIRNLDTDNKSLAVCKAIIGFARDMEIQTVAEFIHSREILDITTELQVDHHQGFYLGEPARASDLFGEELVLS